jgi:predicted RND superfamily exporter protein
VVVVTYGIVVDDTIHGMAKYIHGRRKLGMSAEQAVHYVFSTVGTAAWAMSAILMSGFLVLATSSFALNSDLGIMTALTIALALSAEFFMLPPLLMLFDRRKYVQTPADLAVEPERA